MVVFIGTPDTLEIVDKVYIGVVAGQWTSHWCFFLHYSFDVCSFRLPGAKQEYVVIGSDSGHIKEYSGSIQGVLGDIRVNKEVLWKY